MPNSRHQRNHRHREEDVHNNNNQHASILCLRETPVSTTGNHARQNDNAGARLQKCCTPCVCRSPEDTVDPEEPFDAVKVECNNENCTEGTWMHKDCFDDFQQSVLAYLRSCGRARSWSEKQRLQNLWTKKGYDLAFKACDCRCGRGHLRKNLDYIPAPFNENAKKHKKHKKKNDKPMPVVSTTLKANSHSSHTGHVSGNGTTPITTTPTPLTHQPHGPRIQPGHAVSYGGRNEKKGRKWLTRCDAGQRSDSNGNPQQPPAALDKGSGRRTGGAVVSQGLSIPSITIPALPSGAWRRERGGSVSSTGSHSSSSSSSSSALTSLSLSPTSSSLVSGDAFFRSRKSSEASSEGGPPTSPPVPAFPRRVDLSAFAALPCSMQNPYHIRMDDPGLTFNFAPSRVMSPTTAQVGEEAGSCDLDTRNFVLSNLLSRKMSEVRCALCKASLPVYDRCPLLDGTFFLSPQSYDDSAIQVVWEGRLQFLNAACVRCVSGHTIVRCAACRRPWEGGQLVLGSMYTFDVFAAQPCCQKRLTCKSCRRAVLDLAKGLEFYSQYSHLALCPYCHTNDYHFVRSLPETFTVSREGAAGQGAICG
ncbi:hypothetical protein ACOMHN_008014 [Nucella lapillus]